MKRLIKYSVVSIVVMVVISLGTLRFFGLEPKDQRPGLWLTGELATEPVKMTGLSQIIMGRFIFKPKPLT